MGKTSLQQIMALLLLQMFLFSGLFGFAQQAQAVTEIKRADSHIAGDCLNPNNALGASDGIWAGDVNVNVSCISRYTMANPTGSITGTQTIGVIARKGSNSGNPTLAINLFENGVLVQAVAPATSITSTTGQTVSGTFDASAIIDPNLVEIEIVVVGAGGSPSARNSAQFDSIDWTVNLATASITLGTGTDPASATVAPESGIRDAGTFTLQTTSGTDSVTALTVILAAAGTPFDGLSEVRITSDDGVTLYFAAIASPASNTLNFSGGTAIPVSTTSTPFKIRVTPKTHANMPVPAGAEYALSPRVSAFTSTNSQTGSDSNANTLTIDNLSPAGATVNAGSVAGDQNVTVNWTSSSDTGGPFDTTNGSVVYRWTAASAGSETPTEGITPTLGSVNGTAIVACLVSSAISTGLSKINGLGGSADCTTVALTNGQAYTYKVFSRDTRGNYDVGFLIGTFTPTASTVITVDEIGTQTTPLIIPSTGNYIGGAFTMIRGTGTANVTSIMITESGTVDALTNLNNIKLQYDLDITSPYNCVGESYAVGDTQYGVTDTNGFSAADGTSTFTGSVAVSDVQAMCVYVVLDVLSGAGDGQTMIVRIANPSTDVLVSAGTVSPSTAQGLGTTTLEVPKITVATEGTQANMIIGVGDNNVGGAFSFTRNTASANVTSIIITDTGTVNANLNIPDVVIFYKQEVTCSTSIPVDATQFNGTGVGFNASEKATATGTMAVGTSKICVYVRVDAGDGAANAQTLEIEISNPSTEVTASAGSVTPATAVAIAGTTTLNLPTFTSQGIPFLYTSANWGTDGSGVSFFLEVYMRQTTGTVYARLLNETDTTAVSGSTLSTTSATFTRLRTAALTLVNGKTYRVQFGKIGADAGETLGGKFVVNQNQGGGGGGGGGGGADIAETYFAEEDSLTAGDVVSLSENQKLFVQKSSSPYDQKLLGVISTSPKIVLGEENNGMVQVALLGRVPIKVNLEGGQIQVGDYLTSSSVPGVAMKASQVGRVIGMAIEPYNGEEGIDKILVFINPHWYSIQLGIIGSSTSESTSTPESADTGFIGKVQETVKSVLASLGLFIENGIAQLQELTARKIVVERLEVKEAVIETAQIKNLEVSQKIKLRDFITNEVYCAWIELGEWKKEKCEQTNDEGQGVFAPVENQGGENSSQEISVENQEQEGATQELNEEGQGSAVANQEVDSQGVESENQETPIVASQGEGLSMESQESVVPAIEDAPTPIVEVVPIVEVAPTVEEEQIISTIVDELTEDQQ